MDSKFVIDVLYDGILETIFSLLNLRDLRNCMIVCKRWYYIINEDEDNEIWRLLCVQNLSDDAYKSDVLSSVKTFKAILRAYMHSWNTFDCSRNIFIRSPGFILHRNPVAQSTDGARAKIGYDTGRHAWEVSWNGPLGTIASIGVSTKEAGLQSVGYVPILGTNKYSWGWNLVDNNLLHNGELKGNYPLMNNAPKYQVGEKIRLILDCEDNQLSFEKNYEFLGLAFKNLPKKKLYPTISAVYGNTEVSIVYLGYPLDG